MIMYTDNHFTTTDKYYDASLRLLLRVFAQINDLQQELKTALCTCITNNKRKEKYILYNLNTLT